MATKYFFHKNYTYLFLLPVFIVKNLLEKHLQARHKAHSVISQTTVVLKPLYRLI